MGRGKYEIGNIRNKNILKFQLGDLQEPLGREPSTGPLRGLSHAPRQCLVDLLMMLLHVDCFLLQSMDMLCIRFLLSGNQGEEESLDGLYLSIRPTHSAAFLA